MDQALTTLYENGSFLEGPRWHLGALYFSDFFTDRVLRWDEAGVTTAAEIPGQPSGLGFDRSGNLLAVSMNRQSVWRWRDGRAEPVADLSAYVAGPCNDMLVDPRGRAYVGAFGWDLAASETVRASELLLLGSGGDVEVAATDLVFPNGMALSRDGATLYVAETFAARVSAFAVRADGRLCNRRTLVAFSPGPFETVSAAVASGAVLPDGIALDAAGNLWIGSATGHALLWVSPSGCLIGRVEVGALTPFSVAVGGAACDQLFICANPPMGSCDPAVTHRARLLRLDLSGTGRRP